MRLVRLSLENWRGVQAREVEFAEGVTLIEGPNEVGKSTIVEALHTLFSELESSKKQSVKSIQPVGQDVGSTVAAEVITGDFHFNYSKTYNKKTQTELKILAPKAEQLTGREAHERVEQILKDTMDMALWDALLVEQGKEVAGARLADSHGLARALDEAAGSSSPEQEDSDLYSSVQAEYEKHFTLKTGKSRIDSLKNEVEIAQATFENARTALAEIQTDSDDHARCVIEIQRINDMLPELQKNVTKREGEWKIVDQLQQSMERKLQDLDTAQQLLKTAKEAQERRKQLADDLAASTQALKKKRIEIQPLMEQAEKLKGESESADAKLRSARESLKKKNADIELARDDQQHLLALDELSAVQKRLDRYRDYTKQAEVERKILAGIKISPEGVKKLHETSGKYQVAAGRLDTATSKIEITAEKKLSLAIDGQKLELAKGKSERRSVSAELRLAVPGVANIRFMPSTSVTDLESEATDLEAALDTLLKKYGVNDLADAVATEAKRADAERDLRALIVKSDELLEDDTEADLQARVEELKSDCAAYTGKRGDKPKMPADKVQANKQLRDAEQAQNTAQQSFDDLQNECNRCREKFLQAESDRLLAVQAVEGLELDQKNKKKRLNDARDAESDEAIDAQVVEKTAREADVQKELNTLNEQLESVSPESVENLMNNAREVCKRAEGDLTDQKQQLAVLGDRLTKAQANGRFEALEEAERELEELQARYEARQTRAAAAALLWETLNKHRDETRKAYVRPLKEGIERLGKMVFGEDFSIELGEDWTLVSRTLGGKTLPFDELSIGAKEQLGILTRLAAARIVSSQGGVPLIIDDALGFSDPGRLETMGAAIAAAGRESQIILLSCTPGRFMHVGSAEKIRFERTSHLAAG